MKSLWRQKREAFRDLEVLMRRADAGEFLPAIDDIVNVSVLKGTSKLVEPVSVNGIRYTEIAWIK